LDQSGLDGADLEDSFTSQGKGVADGLLESSVDSSKHEEVMGSFSQGAVAGLLNNPNLSPSGTTLVDALTEGLLDGVGNNSSSSVTGSGKGLIIKEILNGVKTEVSGRSDLTDSSKDDFIGKILDNATSTLIGVGNSAIAGAVQDNLFNSNSEVHVVSIYWAASTGMSHVDSPATVTIASGTKPVILVLTSYEGTNWHLAGATSRVSKVILHGYYDQFVDTVDPSKVEMYSHESNNGYFYNIKMSNWFYTFAEPWTQAFLVRIRQLTGSHITSYQGAYEQNSFTVGDGNHVAGGLAGLSLVRPWLYSLDYNVIRGYQMSGQPNIYSVFYLTKALTSATQIRIWVEYGSATSSDIPAYDHTYTVNAGVQMFQMVIPFNQNNMITDNRTFKVHVEAPSSVFNFQKVINGVLVGGSGYTPPVSSGTTTVGGLMQMLL
jgi:hypothetical protein